MFLLGINVSKTQKLKFHLIAYCDNSCSAVSVVTAMANSHL